jgi:outer membrane protein TolC
VRPVRRLAVAALAVLSLPGVVRAGEEAPAAPVPPAAAAAAKEGPLPEVRTLRLALKEAVALALRNNLDLRVAAFGPSVAAANLVEEQALYEHLFTARVNGGERKTPQLISGSPPAQSEDVFGASVGVRRLLPTGGTVSLDAGMDRTLTNLTYITENPYYDATLGLSLRQPLLRGFGKAVTEAPVRFAQDARDYADLRFRSSVEDLVRRVEVTYWLLVNARGDLESREESVKVSGELVRINEVRLRAGAGTNVDVSQARAGQAARQVDRLRAENNLRTLEESLLGLLFPRSPDAATGGPMHLEPADDPRESLPDLPPEDPEAAVQRALLSRSDLRLLRVLVDQSEVGVLQAESQALVRLDLSASVQYAGIAGTLGQAENDSMLSREFPSWTVGLFLEVPLGNRAARARLDRAVLQRSQAEAQVRAGESEAAVRVRNARRDLESAREQIRASHEATSLAEEQLKAENERLRNDKSTTFEVLRLESDLTDARRSELRALVDYRSAVTRYDYETGRILETRALDVPAPAR